MPLSGAISTRRDDHGVRFTSLRADGRRHIIDCSAAASTFNDAGEGIRQTVMADLSLDGHRRAAGTVGLEFRD